MDWNGPTGRIFTRFRGEDLDRPIIDHFERVTLGAPGSQIIGFDQDNRVTALHYEKRNLRRSFEQYRALREANLARLKTPAKGLYTS